MLICIHALSLASISSVRMGMCHFHLIETENEPLVQDHTGKNSKSVLPNVKPLLFPSPLSYLQHVFYKSVVWVLIG